MDDLGIPDFLRREDTPESKAARERIAKSFRGHTSGRKLTPTKVRSTITTGLAILDEAGKEILREQKREADRLARDKKKAKKENSKAAKRRLEKIRADVAAAKAKGLTHAS